MTQARSARWLAAPLLAFALVSLTAGLLARHQPRSKGYFRLFFSDPVHLKARLVHERTLALSAHDVGGACVRHTGADPGERARRCGRGRLCESLRRVPYACRREGDWHGRAEPRLAAADLSTGATAGAERERAHAVVQVIAQRAADP
jgi:hypothetical protein